MLQLPFRGNVNAEVCQKLGKDDVMQMGVVTPESASDTRSRSHSMRMSTEHKSKNDEVVTTGASHWYR